MDKKEFLSKLEQSLSILEEDELRDIISEYEQHIDMKVEKGLTEEEAITDFGSFQELTEEILEAYHVRADYAIETGKIRNKPKKNICQEKTDMLVKLKEVGSRGSYTLWSGIKEAGFWLKNGFRWVWMQVRRPFFWVWEKVLSSQKEKIDRDTAEETEILEEKTAETEEMIQQENTNRKEDFVYKRRSRQTITGGDSMRTAERTGNAIVSGGKAVGKTISGIVQWGMNVVFVGICAAWNICWILFSLFTGSFGLMSLFGIGVLLVLLLEGYPLLGVTLGCLGLVFCMFSAAGLGVTLLKGREQEEKTESFSKTRQWENKTDQRKQDRWEQKKVQEQEYELETQVVWEQENAGNEIKQIERNQRAEKEDGQNA